MPFRAMRNGFLLEALAKRGAWTSGRFSSQLPGSGQHNAKIIIEKPHDKPTILISEHYELAAGKPMNSKWGIDAGARTSNGGVTSISVGKPARLDQAIRIMNSRCAKRTENKKGKGFEKTLAV